eukprot:scaffold395617_cov35-Attheya_sp.AAC.1
MKSFLSILDSISTRSCDQPLLDAMLTRGQDAWEQAYQQASIILRDNAEKHSYVSNIHENPKYYSAWYTCLLLR